MIGLFRIYRSLAGKSDQGLPKGLGPGCNRAAYIRRPAGYLTEIPCRWCGRTITSTA